ncbi:ModD protein [Clostridium formicaceticum]|uniref:Putative pyrophosphorylase ModD n=2 Tax=Clostridium formicaceticum TaxID=1497 RepID=A0ABN4TIA5_9CLOT|nr:ModD protein [Clostridium formicaceticum]AOY78466.1 ModD protein [Clostridium formicaceticum]
MMYINDETIERFLKEDVSYIDLTTLVMGIGNEKGQICFTTREDMVLSGVEEVLRIFGKLGIKTIQSLPSGTIIKSGETFIIAEGLASNLHMAWKVSLNILEYCCGIATRTKRLVDKARSVNPKISIVSTRKSFPGTKELVIKSIIAGGAFPHRLGLSETILIFKQHVNFLGDFEGLSQIIGQIKINACEKKIIVEVENETEAMLIAGTDIDGLQFDKVPISDLRSLVEKVRHINPQLTLIAAGGINESNIEGYASTDVDAIATSSVYFGKPADIKVTIDKY